MIKEFFGIGGYSRTPEGYMSWQHLTFVSSLMAAMIVLAVVIGIKNRNKPQRSKNKVIIFAAVFIDVLEILRIVIKCIDSDDVGRTLLISLPLFLCSIMLIAIPLAAFTHGRIKEACLDFVFIFGVMCAFLGTYGAGQDYNAYPVLSFQNVSLGINHAISGFTALYIAFSRMVSMKWKNIPITFGILAGFCGAAYLADRLIPYNYMFLITPDGTPYTIIYDLVQGNQVLYPILVVLLFVVYIAAFYGVYYLIKRIGKKKIS